ncbi:hypothetical protein LEMLEM_LOCUS10398, partial [Lemmus lemmus]
MGLQYTQPGTLSNAPLPFLSQSGFPGTPLEYLLVSRLCVGRSLTQRQ